MKIRIWTSRRNHLQNGKNIVPTGKNAAKQLRDLVKEGFVRRGGMCGGGDQADAQARIIKRYTASLPGERIAFQKGSRLIAKTREQNPDGQPFDTRILDETPGEGFRMRV